MIRCETIKDFTLARFSELKNIERKGIEQKGKLFVGDTFECSKELADYLMGNNLKGYVVVKVIEVIPIIGHRKDDVEYVTPLIDKEELDKLGKEISKYVVVKPTKKKKTSKK